MTSAGKPHPAEFRPIPIAHDLALELAAYLELVLRVGIPNPEHAAQLLRRINDAIRHSARAKTA